MKTIITLVLLLSFNLSFAKYRQTCAVRYSTEDGWSKKYIVDVTFMSGFELNQATSSYRYSSYSVYALIFWGRDEVTIIKLSSYVLCGYEVDRNCIAAASLSDLKGSDQDDDQWRICVGNYCY
jgi:hypothetical protein